MGSLHCGELAHGVTPLESGTRYSLFVSATQSSSLALTDVLVGAAMDRVSLFGTDGWDVVRDAEQSVADYVEGKKTIATEVVRQVHALAPRAYLSGEHLPATTLMTALEREVTLMTTEIDPAAFATRSSTLPIVEQYLTFLQSTSIDVHQDVPSPEIDVIWHTHMSLPRYASDCLTLTGSIIDHIINDQE